MHEKALEIRNPTTQITDIIATPRNNLSSSEN